MINFDMPKEKSSIIKVIGVGGGGSNAVNHMYKQGIEGVDFIVVNTDAQTLYQSPVPNKIQIGTNLTEGRGAGSIPEKGKEAALESIEEIREALSSNTKMVFITAGMGGGTGTGAAPIIASIAKEMGILTVGIVTIPFAFEGRKRKMQAEKGIEEIKNNVDAMLVICNDKLRELYGNLKLSEAFAKADDVLTSASKGIAEIITVAGYINVDFEDVSTVMRNSGVAIMGTGQAEGENRATRAVEEALSSPLLNDNNIKGAKNILLYISSGEEEISMDEVSEVTEYIQYEAGSDADVIWGNGTDSSLGNNISVTLVVTGFDMNEDMEIKPPEDKEEEKIVKELEMKEDNKKLDAVESDDGFMVIKKGSSVKEEEIKEDDKPKKIFTLDNEDEKEETVFPKMLDDNPIEFSVEKNQYQQIDDFNSVEKTFKSTEDYKDTINENTNVSEENQENETLFDVENKSEGIETEKFKERKKKLKNLSLSLNTDTKIAQNTEDIVEMESVPAYERKGIELNDVTPASESEISRLSLSEEEDEEGNTHINLNTSNSFIHDNVD